jgi:hypothetical protein
MSFKVVGYFTTGTLYEQQANRLIKSLRTFSIPYFMKPIQDKGGWYKNTQYKPQFLKEVLDRFYPEPLVYVDADAEFLCYPELFDEISVRSDIHIGVHVLDHAKRAHSRSNRFEMLSGTIYLRNDDVTRHIIDQWIVECSKGGTLWDQVALKSVLAGIPYYMLPEEYCTIFDYMSDVQSPVIKHYQASRKAKKYLHTPLPTYERIPDSQPSNPTRQIIFKPRKVTPGGTIRYSRKWRHS